MRNELTDKLILASGILLLPNLNSSQRKLLHQDVPAIQVGVTLNLAVVFVVINV